MAQQLISGVRGMHDILPEEAERWELFEELVRSWLCDYGYRPIRTPIVEFTPLFVRAVGADTDIVEKEMYAFEDKLNGDALVLRPEGTASCVRAVLEHNLINAAGPQRLYYHGPMFRHERPQKGRLRQFHQVGVEALGFTGPDIDAEHIVMCGRLWRDLGLEEDIALEINSLGSPDERAAPRRALIAYVEANREQLDADAQRRLHTNPLRILDTKNPAMQALVEAAPQLIEHLGEESRAHYEGVQHLLREASLPYRINPRLVRGLDYYNRTVFEWVTDKLGAQATVCAGGRYDGLVEQLGGKPTPACGFAMGMERLMLLWAEIQGDAARSAPDVYFVHQGAAAAPYAFRQAEALREQGFAVVLHCGGGSFKSQMKKADASGAAVAVIAGDDEVARDELSFKPLREDGEQGRTPAALLGDTLAAMLYNMEEEDGSV